MITGALKVALLTECVDRNPQVAAVPTTAAVSPSSRRAWIEINATEQVNDMAYVALLTEGVDRNRLQLLLMRFAVHVALLTEGVDRNILRE